MNKEENVFAMLYPMKYNHACVLFCFVVVIASACMEFMWCITKAQYVLGTFNTLKPRQNGCRFADYVSKCISLNENFGILNKISLKYTPQGVIENMAVLD